MNLIILGASARAAAFSAHRAGLSPWCIDLFADADLQARFPVRKVPLAAYPHGILAELDDAPDGPVLYTGGLENHPDLLARIGRPLWGNSPEVLRRVRDPFLLAETLRRHGWPALEVRREPPPPGDRRQWLLKPLRGSGGIGIRHYDGRPFDPTVHYLQEYTLGSCLGTVFLGMPERGALWLGTCWPLAKRWLQAPPFHYTGSVVAGHTLLGPRLKALGDLLVREFGLVGLFGVDTVLQTDPRTRALEVLPLEVNPRYTASVEILERAWNRSLLELHSAVCERRPIIWDSSMDNWTAVPGKAVLYARRELVFPADGPWRPRSKNRPPSRSMPTFLIRAK